MISVRERSTPKKFMLDVPFYDNLKGDGNQCGQVALQSVVKYFLGKELTLDELDALTARKPDQQSWTQQLVAALYKLGLGAKFFSSEALEPFLRGEPFIKEHYGDYAETIIRITNLEALVSSARLILERGAFERRSPTMEEIEGEMRRGHVPIMLVDYSVLEGSHKGYAGHYLTLTGFDEQHVYCHQSGPEDAMPNMPVEKRVLMDAWHAKNTDSDLIIVSRG